MFTDRLEAWLEAERASLPLWSVVALGGGISAWLALPDPAAWTAFFLLTAALALFSFGFGAGRRVGRAAGWFALGLAAGCALIWSRSAWVEAPRLTTTRIVIVTGPVDSVETLAAREVSRVVFAPTASGLRLRVAIPQEQRPPDLRPGARIRLRARLTPPMAKPLPGAHDFARDSWFAGIGGIGRAIGPVEVLTPAPRRWSLDSLRSRLDAHIRSRLAPAEGAIATAFVSGDQGYVSEGDAEAMRRSGLAHLLSVSGLHIAAVIGATMLLSLRLLALSERLALRVNLVVVSAAFGALAGIGYTVLTGSQVPTVRSCLGALIVMIGMALGRDALSLRVVAAAALLILLVRPEALAGASFQLSFAAVTVIIALHSSRWVRAHLGPTDAGLAVRGLRGLASLTLTGLAVEIGLMPFALFHFHRAGLYGVGANLVAIPLTTFVIMPLEALALVADLAGWGAPVWWACGQAIHGLLWLARATASASGAVASLPSMPVWAFGSMVAGGIWLCLWQTRSRYLGCAAILVGAAGAWASPAPDLQVTGDGRHLAVTGPDGTPAVLRERSGDFVRDMLGETAGFDGELPPLAGQPYARCTLEACVAVIVRDGRAWRLLALRSTQKFRWTTLAAACRQADIVVADRRVPRGCLPRLWRLDGPFFRRSGGLAISLRPRPRMLSVAEEVGDHPWRF